MICLDSHRQMRPLGVALGLPGSVWPEEALVGVGLSPRSCIVRVSLARELRPRNHIAGRCLSWGWGWGGGSSGLGVTCPEETPGKGGSGLRTHVAARALGGQFRPWALMQLKEALA